MSPSDPNASRLHENICSNEKSLPIAVNVELLGLNESAGTAFLTFLNFKLIQQLDGQTQLHYHRFHN